MLKPRDLDAFLLSITPDDGSPEKNLLAAMLLRAVMDMASMEERPDALAWFKGHPGTMSPKKRAKLGWSFEEVCCYLNLDPHDTFRRVLEIWPEPILGFSEASTQAFDEGEVSEAG